MLRQDERAIPANAGDDGNIRRGHMEDRGIRIDRLNGRNVRHLRREKAGAVFLDIGEGIRHVLSGQLFAVRPVHVLAQMEGDVQTVIADFPGLGGIRNDLLGRIQLDQLAVKVLRRPVEIVVRSKARVERERVAVDGNDERSAAAGFLGKSGKHHGCQHHSQAQNKGNDLFHGGYPP